MKKIYLIVTAFFLTSFLNAQTKEYKITTERTTEISKKYSSHPTVYKIISKEIGTPIKIEVPNELYVEIQEKINSLVKDSLTKTESLKPDFEIYKKQNQIVSEIVKYLNSTEKEKIKKEYLISAQNISNELNLKYAIYPNKNLSTPLSDICNQINYRNRKPTIKQDLIYNLNEERRKLNKTAKTKTEIKNNSDLKRTSLVLISEVEDIKTISGNFKLIDNEYIVLKKDIEGYSANELVDKETASKKNIPFESIADLGSKRLIFNEITKEYYFTDYIFLGEYALDMTLVNFEEKLNKLGYKTDSKNDDILIFVNGLKLILTNDIFQNVNNGNINYIKDIANSVKQFNSYVIECKPLTEKLVNHYSSHKNKTMNSTRMNQWKSDLNNAKNIYNKINSLKGNEIENITSFNQQIDINILEKYNEFNEVLKGSEIVLGM